MNRRHFFTQAALGTAVSAQAQNILPSSEAPTMLVITPPVVMAPRTDGVEIVWGISRHARGWVELKTGDEVSKVGGTEFGFSTQGEKALRVRLDGLKAGKTFAYRTVTEAMGEPAAREESAWREFRTLDAAAKETRFAVWNDTHVNNTTIAQLHEKTPTKVDFLLWNGDICNDWHKDETLVPTLLHPAGTDFTAQRPLAFVWGNHDLRGAYGYRLPNYVAAPAGRSYYAFRSGPVAFVCLNTGEDKADDHPSFKGRVACEPLRREQAEWIREHVLKTPELRDAPYRVVFCHIPLRWKIENEVGREYDSFSRRSRELWHEALVAWGAQVVISGHMHETHWMEGTKEFPYAQLVGGGPKPEAATYMEAHADATRLEITMKNLAGEVVHQPVFKPLA